MVLGVTPMTRTKRLAALRDVFLDGHIGIAKHDTFGFSTLRGQDLKLLTSVARLAFLNASRFVGLHVSGSRLADFAGYLGVPKGQFLADFRNSKIKSGLVYFLHHLKFHLMLLKFLL